jgi:predicted transcriptional regulator
MYDMKTAAVTIRLDPELEELLDEVCRKPANRAVKWYAMRSGVS